MTERPAPKIFYQLTLAFREPDDQIIPRGKRRGRPTKTTTTIAPEPPRSDPGGDEPNPMRPRRRKKSTP